MRFGEIQVQGYGKLLDRRFSFAPGLNVVLGPNEAGKSTLQLALMTMLYGFFGEGPVSAEMRSARDALRPWTGSRHFGGSLTYSLQDGRAFRVQRTFAPRASTSLESIPDGRDITSHFPSANQGRLFFADHHLGVSRDVFQQSCFVYQSELAALEHSASAITDRLMQVSASASSDTTVVQALKALEVALQNEVGTDRASTKPLVLARNRLAELETERQASAKATENLMALAAEAAENRVELEWLTDRREELRYLYHAARYHLLQREQAERAKHQTEVEHWSAEAERYSAWAGFPVELRDDVVVLGGRLSDQRREVEASRMAGDAARKQLPGVEAELAALQARVADLEGARDISPRGIDEVVNLWNRRGQALQGARETEERLQQAEADLLVREQPVKEAAERLEPALRIGQSGIAALEQRLTAATTRVDEAQSAFVRAASNWEACANSPTADDWETFPSQRAEEVNALLRRIHDDEARVRAQKLNADKAADTLRTLEAERLSVMARLGGAASASADANREAAAQALINEWRAQTDRVGLIEGQWQHAQSQVSQAEYRLGRERKDLESALRLGVSGLEALRQRMSSANRRLNASEDGLSQARAEWSRVGMDEARFAQLEADVRAFRAGSGTLQERRGCLAVFSRPAAGEPPDARIYDDVKPIHDRLPAARAAAHAALEERDAVLREIRTTLGSLIGDPPTEAAFGALSSRVQSLLVAQRAAEEQRSTNDKLAHDLENLRRQEYEARALALSELSKLGVTASDPQAALDALSRFARERERRRDDEIRLQQIAVEEERLRNAADAHQALQRALDRAGADLRVILQDARCDGSTLDSAVEMFHAGVAAQQRWKELLLARQEQESARAAVVKALGRLAGEAPDAETLSGLMQEMEVHRQDGAALDGQRLSVERLRQEVAGSRSELGSMQARLETLLRSLSIEVKDLDRAVDTALDLREQQGELARLEPQIEGVRLRGAALRRDLGVYEERVRALEDAETQLRDLLQRAEIDEATLEAEVLAFEYAVEQHSNWAQAEKQRQQALQVQQVQRQDVGDSDSSSLLAELEREVTEALAAHAEWANLALDATPEEYMAQLRDTENALADVRRRRGEIEGEINGLSEAHRHPAAIEEDMAIARARIEHLVQLRNDLQRAHDDLASAMWEFQKQFAPQLEMWMGEGLERITRGRYRNVAVDPVTLAVQIESGEAGGLVPIQRLSSGMRDVAYLMLRVAIARFMSRSGERLPLLLDDPFIRLDDQRTIWALNYLISLAGETQVLLFTKDQAVRDWFNRTEESSDHQLHELEQPALAAGR